MEDQKPKLKDLNKYVIPHVGPKWEDLGIELELDDDGQLLDEIKRDRRGDEEKCCLDVVKKWLQGAGVEPKTWRKLLECLREIAATDAINSIEANILKGPGASHSSIHQPAVETHQPLPRTDAPTDRDQQLAVETQQPLPRTDAPTDRDQQPVVETHQPLPRTDAPTDRDQQLAVETQQPLPRTDAPTDRDQQPVVETHQPLPRTDAPIDRDQQLAVETHQPLPRTDAPIDRDQQLAVETHQPLPRTDPPTDRDQQLAVETHQPLPRTDAPTDRDQQLAVETHQPLPQTDAPIDRDQQPAVETHQPLPRTDAPTDRDQQPAVETHQPLPRTDAPTDRDQQPAVETHQPLPRTDAPTDRDQHPAVETPLPRTDAPTDGDQRLPIQEELSEQPKPELLPRGMDYSEESSTSQSASQTIDYSIQLEPGKQVRKYQWELAMPGIQGENYIICAPTGTGKTLTAALVISDHLQKRQRKGKVIFIVDTRPLAQQQKEALEKMIRGSRVECCVGEDFSRMIQTLLPHQNIIVCTAGKFLDELRQDKVHFKDISLIVFDECHHTRKNAPYAEIMWKFHEEKQEGIQMPQVVGLTASPGAGTRLPELDKVIDYLVSLCALLDASGGIKRVTKNVAELDRYTNKPTFTLKILNRRNPSEPFIGRITAEMRWLEEECLRDPLKCPFDKWSQEYETSIQQRKQPLELSTNPDERDQISALELLRLYSQVLSIYMDLRYEDAMSVLNEYAPTSTEQASHFEKKMARRLEELKANVSRLPKVQNPLLENVEGILQKHFSEKPASKGIFFVRTKQHAHCITEWIGKLPGIRPCVITGHSRESGPEGMTDVEKTQAIKSFQDEKYNLLVATSVAEEGLDVPACNLVIRFQHVSNEIAKVQTRGRARASDAEGFTILSSDSRKRYQEMVNEELETVVEEALQHYFPQGSVFHDKMYRRQEEIIRERALKKALRGQSQAAQKSEHVLLKCKKCKVFACYGSDVYTIEGATHYVVPDEDFKATKINIKPHSKPKQISQKMYKKSKIFCAGCDYDWGVMCTWPVAGYEFPLLKCKSFIFEVNGIPCPVGKWSDAPFEKHPLSSKPEYQEID